MANNLLIVESPAKATTINRYLGDDFEVLASYGHIRDLPSKDGAVNTDEHFAMRYELSEGSKKHVDRICSAARQADAIYLATDLDREGEAISWHIHEILRERGIAQNVPFYRVEFSEITPRAIEEAMRNPRELSMDLVNAQQARRALDHLVGFNLSPLLWKKIKTGLSAGRVQSPALRLIVEREREIERFKAQEYWSIEADLLKDDQPFVANLVQLAGRKFQQFDIGDAQRAAEVRERLLAAAGGQLKADRITRKQRKRRPAPPFITSTLQQDAARKLRFSAQQTMRIAQQLYEGVQIEGVREGLITYMRTDSVALSRDALGDLRGLISSKFGPDYLPEKPVYYKTKSKNAQEAHEAIRPTFADLTPERVKSFLSPDQFKLYELIWKRAVASQMRPALLDTVAVEFDCGTEGVFRANGSVITFPGFLAIYEVSVPQGEEEQERRLPSLDEGERVQLAEIRAEQHFTEPPPRYSEASLVKALEEYGIGRPSTYASIISTLLRRNYVVLDRRRFIPTDTGRVVERFLENHFDHYVDYEFTARLEDELDAISRGERDWIPVLEEFWEPFIGRVREKEQSVSREEAKQTRVLGTDPKTGKEVSVRLGRYGPYAQIGTREDEDKPQFAGLRSGQSLETIALEEALELFKLPRDLGFTPEGEEVAAGIGRYGPFIRYGKKFVSLKEEDPHTVTLARALELVAEKKAFDANRVIRQFEGTDIQVLRGRYGPYITDGAKNARVPKDREPESLTQRECEELLAAAPERKRGRKKAVRKKAATRAGAGRKKAARSADSEPAPATPSD
ncbi:MAG: DNA topoisomerase I [Xanthomonadales bacterium]|nr:DNA topoisomerase I [Xanthomonadales bacterium]NIN60142.1 DNA topoisomerase I [Xanthomonadales bacterium]NIN74289.1 DNA topoisomerase I [Xanthomonadales bacterium]NIO12798.1 DNA topoisomerase I [Xanthomonadales bacterium]NIP12535.1 DNA topoisomerase I [Xanthomonadales bacterium]